MIYDVEEFKEPRQNYHDFAWSPQDSPQVPLQQDTHHTPGTQPEDEEEQQDTAEDAEDYEEEVSKLSTLMEEDEDLEESREGMSEGK